MQYEIGIHWQNLVAHRLSLNTSYWCLHQLTLLALGIPTDRQCSAHRGRSRQICRFLTCVYYISECIIWIKLMVLSSWVFLLSFHIHIISLDHVLNKREADKQGAYASPTARFVRVVGAVSWTPWHKTCYFSLCHLTHMVVYIRIKTCTCPPF